MGSKSGILVHLICAYIAQPRPLPLPERTQLVEVGKGHRPQSFRRCSEAGTSRDHPASQGEGKSDQRTSGRVGVGTLRRKDIDRKYEFRNSRLKGVLGRLFSEQRLVEEDLRGLSKDKVEQIRSFAKFLAEDVA